MDIVIKQARDLRFKEIEMQIVVCFGKWHHCLTPFSSKNPVIEQDLSFFIEEEENLTLKFMGPESELVFLFFLFFIFYFLLF